jgi:hypothetical protein
MQATIRELPHSDVPRTTVYATGITCGILAAIAVQILMSHSGIQLSTVWRSLRSDQGLQLQSASVWWLMAGSAFLAGVLVVASLSRLPLPWHSLRGLRWIAGAAVVFGLAEVGHIAGSVSAPVGGTHLVVTLVALFAASLISLFGAYFAIKR